MDGKVKVELSHIDIRTQRVLIQRVIIFVVTIRRPREYHPIRITGIRNNIFDSLHGLPLRYRADQSSHIHVHSTRVTYRITWKHSLLVISRIMDD